MNIHRSLAVAVTALVASYGFSLKAQQTSFEEIASRYAAIRSVHLKSTATVTRRTSTGRVVTGSMKFEYWADSNGYRANCSSDPQLELVEDMELARNGTTWQLLQPEKNQLGVSTDAKHPSPLACPNPLFVLVEFMGDGRPGCESCSVELKDLAEPAPKAVAVGTDEYLVGDHSNGQPRRFKLTVARFRGEAVPASLERLYPSRRKAVQFVASGFRATEVGPVPNTIVGKAYEDRDGSPQIDTLEYSIREIEVNRPIDERLFALDSNAAMYVFDIDAGLYLKHPNLSEINENLLRLKPKSPPSNAR